MTPLSEHEEAELLSTLTQWDVVEREGCRELHRVYRFPSFEAAFDFMSRAARGVISDQDHHPRWENTYSRVEVWLTTHDAGNQITQRDRVLAEALEGMWDELGLA